MTATIFREEGWTKRVAVTVFPDVDEPTIWYEGSDISTRRWFHADERGSVIAVSDASGNLVGGINRYDEYGAPQGTLTGRFGYTGQVWLPEAGLYHYRERAYHPALGRFMQADPIGYDGGMNLYAYVGNNPVNFTDPLGLDPPCPIPTNCPVVFGTLTGGGLGLGSGGSGSNTVVMGASVSSNPGVEQTIIVVATPLPGHNRPPRLSFWDVVKSVFRRSPFGVIWCVLVCQGPEVQQQLDLSDVVGDMLNRSTEQTRRGAAHRDYRTRGSSREDLQRLAAACGCQITANPNGSFSFQFLDRTFTRYRATSTEGGWTISMRVDDRLIAKFRY